MASGSSRDAEFAKLALRHPRCRFHIRNPAQTPFLPGVPASPRHWNCGENQCRLSFFRYFVDKHTKKRAGDL